MKQEIRNRVVGDLLTRLQKAGFKFYGIGILPLNGTERERRQVIKKYFDDRTHTYLILGFNNCDKWLSLNTSNDPECLVEDFSVNEKLHEVVTDFQNRWKDHDDTTDIIKDYEKRFRKIYRQLPEGLQSGWVSQILIQIPTHLRK